MVFSRTSSLLYTRVTLRTACISAPTGNVCWIEELAAPHGFSFVTVGLYFGGRETYGPQTADVLRETLAHAIAAFARLARRDSARRNLVASCPQHIDLWDGGGSLFYLKSAAIDYHGYTVQDLNAQRSSDIRMIEPRKSAFGHGGIATGGTGSGSPC
jgi:hypothetical protein